MTIYYIYFDTYNGSLGLPSIFFVFQPSSLFLFAISWKLLLPFLICYFIICASPLDTMSCLLLFINLDISMCNKRRHSIALPNHICFRKFDGYNDITVHTRNPMLFIVYEGLKSMPEISLEWIYFYYKIFFCRRCNHYMLSICSSMLKSLVAMLYKCAVISMDI